MSHRVGPPTPRNEPWRGPKDGAASVPPESGARPEPCPQAAHDACVFPRCDCLLTRARNRAFSEWLRATNNAHRYAWERIELQTAFDAGWEARKRAQYAPGALVNVPNI
jgi:hypothetical protein